MIIQNPVMSLIKKRTVGHVPVPLKSTSYDIEIEGGLAKVQLKRVFRNDEQRPIEAVMTFPLPFDAAVYRLDVKVDGKVLSGVAQAKEEARETYEAAIDNGKRAVLHEELLRGLHMVSVANVAPGVELEVVATFAMPLSIRDGNGHMHLPVTVGHIFGQQPLPESDQIISGGQLMNADVTVTCSSGTPFVGGVKSEKAVSVPLNRPIEISVIGLDAKKEIIGRAFDGRVVSLNISPALENKQALDIDVMLDSSGSMLEKVSGDNERPLTKWDALIEAVSSAADQHLNEADKVAVWTWSNACQLHQKVRGNQLSSVIESVPFVGGGTQLELAVGTVISSRKEADILLVTDGKSWKPIDINAVIATGARVSVVLIGEDALEVNVGYAAAMTGGQMFVSNGNNVGYAITAALKAMRSPACVTKPIKGLPSQVERSIAGMHVTAVWKKATKSAPERDGMAEAVAAMAAYLAYPALVDGKAIYAASEGLVTNLTSIVLVDEVSEAVDGIPATRKVALPDTATAPVMAFYAPQSSSMRSMAMLSASAAPSPLNEASLGFYDYNHLSANPAARFDTIQSTWNTTMARKSLPITIDWDSNPEGIRRGDFTAFDSENLMLLVEVSDQKEIRELARQLGVTLLIAAIGLVAHRDSEKSRTAQRIARSILQNADQQLLEAAMRKID